MTGTVFSFWLLAFGFWLPSPQAAVKGTIVDAGTGAPIAGARVVLVEPSNTTQSAADGSFSFDAVPPGKYTLTVSIIGYIFVRRQIDVGVAGATDLTIPLTGGTGTYQETVSVSPPTSTAEVGVGA